MRLNTILVAIVLFCLSCQKTHSYKVHGQIIDSTNGLNIPIANTAFELKIFSYPSISAPLQKQSQTFTTDGNGNFITVFDCKNIAAIIVTYPYNDSTLWGAPDVETNIYDYDARIIKTKKP